MSKENGLVTDVERESNPRHDVDLWLIILKGFRVQFLIGSTYQPRCWVNLIDREDVRIIDFCSNSIEPRVAITVTNDGRWAIQCVHINGEVVADVDGEVVAAEPETVVLTPEQQAKLLSFIEGNTRMPQEAKARIVTQIQAGEISAETLARLESRMGG